MMGKGLGSIKKMGSMKSMMCGMEEEEKPKTMAEKKAKFTEHMEDFAEFSAKIDMCMLLSKADKKYLEEHFKKIRERLAAVYVK